VIFFRPACLRRPSRHVRHRQEEVIQLSDRDWNWRFDLVKNAPKPNAKLKAAK
jgi:uncharacterized protein (DUF1778 family)